MAQLERETVKALYVSPEVHRQVSVVAAHQGREKKELTEEALREYFARIADAVGGLPSYYNRQPEPQPV